MSVITDNRRSQDLIKRARKSRVVARNIIKRGFKGAEKIPKYNFAENVRQHYFETYGFTVSDPLKIVDIAKKNDFVEELREGDARVLVKKI